MGLHNCLKIEAHAIPQRKLAAGRAREQASALRGPFDYIDGVFDFVERRVNCLGWNGFSSAGESSGGRGHVDNVAGAGPFGLQHGQVLVTRAAVAQPLDCCCAIVGDSS